MKSYHILVTFSNMKESPEPYPRLIALKFRKGFLYIFKGFILFYKVFLSQHFLYIFTQGLLAFRYDPKYLKLAILTQNVFVLQNLFQGDWPNPNKLRMDG